LIVIPTLEKLWRKAKDYDLNISKVSENALEEMIACIEKPSQREQHENRSNDCLDSNGGAHTHAKILSTLLGEDSPKTPLYSADCSLTLAP